MDVLFNLNNNQDSESQFQRALLRIAAPGNLHNEKRHRNPADAIKNSTKKSPEGHSTILLSPMCNGAVVP